MTPQLHETPQMPVSSEQNKQGRTTSLALEVRFYREDTLVDVGHFEKPSQLTVGSHPLDTFAIVDNAFPDESYPLIVPYKGGFGVFFTEAMELALEPQNGVAHALQPTRKELQTKSWRGIEGHIYPLKSSEILWLKTRQLSICCSLVPHQEKVEIAPVQHDYLLWRILSFSAIAHIALILMFQIVPKGAMALGEATLQNRFSRLIVMPPPPNKAPPKTSIEIKKTLPDEKPLETEKNKQTIPSEVSEPTPTKPKTIQERVRSVGLMGVLSQGMGSMGGGDIFGKMNDSLHLGKILGTAGGANFGMGPRGFGAGGDGNGGGCSYCGNGGKWGTLRSGTYSRRGVGVRIRTRSKRIVERFVQKTVLKGGLTKEQVARVIRANWSQIRYCYERQLTIKPKLSGKIAMSWRIDGTGKVESVDVKESTMNDEGVENCMRRRIMRWRFPVPEGNGVVDVTYPFIFKVAGN